MTTYPSTKPTSSAAKFVGVRLLRPRLPPQRPRHRPYGRGGNGRCDLGFRRSVRGIAHPARWWEQSVRSRLRPKHPRHHPSGSWVGTVRASSALAAVSAASPTPFASGNDWRGQGSGCSGHCLAFFSSYVVYVGGNGQCNLCSGRRGSGIAHQGICIFPCSCGVWLVG